MLRLARVALAASSLVLGLGAGLPACAEEAEAPSSLSKEQLALMSELVGKLRPELAAGDEADKAAALAQLGPYLARGNAAELMPGWLDWAKTEFMHETAGWVGDRTGTLIVFGPPGGIHREKSREWGGEGGSLAASTWDLMLALGGQDPRSPAEELALDWEMATEIWVYPEADGQTLNLVFFGDLDGDGVMRLVLRSQVKAGDSFSSAPMKAVPASLFGADAVEVEVLKGVKELPSLSEDPVALTLDTAYLKATEGRTAARFVVAIDPTDLELELDVDPGEFLAAAKVWLRVTKNGEPVYQDVFEANPAALADLSGLYVDELTTVPLPPGDYQATVLLTDDDGRGGSAELLVKVPSMGGPLGVSSLILTKAIGGTIPKAEASADDFVAFRVGNYVVRPHVGGEFRAGDTLALVVQVYNAASATLEYDLYKDGRLANSLDPVQLKTLPQTDIQLIEVLEVWPSGSYAFKVTAISGGESITREVKFRVRK